jgi:hypothetical protein
MSPNDAWWCAVVVLAGAFTAMCAWVFRRLVVLFAALEAVERIEENAPARVTAEHE